MILHGSMISYKIYMTWIYVGIFPFFGNFLSDRTFQVHLGTILSDKTFLHEEDVPHGAILSTTLFNVKINNIVKQIDHIVECSLYVDDFVIMYKSPTIDAIQRKVQHTINRLEKWTVKNSFTNSKNKTVAMHFCLNKQIHGSCSESGQWPYPVRKRSKISWFVIQNSPLNLISDTSKHVVQNIWTSWKSSPVRNRVQVELHYWNYIAPWLHQNSIMVV